MQTLYSILLVVSLVVNWTAVYLTMSSKSEAADAATCYTIQDGDARTYCLARAHREPSQCYSIQSSAMRSQCLAEVRK